MEFKNAPIIEIHYVAGEYPPSPFTHPVEFLNGKRKEEYAEDSWEFKNWHLLKKRPIGYTKKWPEVLIDHGFAPKFIIDYDPNVNWFGVSTYSPNQILVKDNKHVELSLQGLLMGHPKTKEEYNVMAAVGVKYIAVKIDGVKLWETFFGEQIPQEVFNKLIE